PIWQMMAKQKDELQASAWAWTTKLMARGIPAEVWAGRSPIGGGSLPDETIPTSLLALPSKHPNRWAAALRAHRPAVIVRIEKDHLLLDPRTVFPEQEKELLQAIRATKP
ncbi:MAG: L-seryl-tRNA(Sec) selenium transferase, partial [Ardenticatenaceae bacterium]